jgi:ribulose-5-phosphate 4-epimerase/fuculose-1-phosphate aldolase
MIYTVGEERPMGKSDVIVVREFDPELFHKKVMELEAEGYVANRETYHVTPEMDPEDGKIIHLHAIELIRREN